MQILERDKEFGSRVSFHRNGSSSSSSSLASSFQSHLNDNFSKKSFSYNKLPQEPLNLTVIKLDGSSFDIEVAKTATVAELKDAVEAAFSHLPRNGPGKVSWTHVWGQFCLSYDGQKLLCDTDYIAMYGIQDGDKLHFIRNTSIYYNLEKSRSEKESCDEEQPSISSSIRDFYQERENENYEDRDVHCSELIKFSQDNGSDEEDDCVTTSYEYKLTGLLKGWFSYRRLENSEYEDNDDSDSPKLNQGFFSSFRIW